MDPQLKALEKAPATLQTTRKALIELFDVFATLRANFPFRSFFRPLTSELAHYFAGSFLGWRYGVSLKTQYVCVYWGS
jgi:hypothetical protein